MKKTLFSIRSQGGYILPSVMLLTAVVLFMMATNIISYSHELRMTENLIEQLKAQTLFQMGYEQFTSTIEQNDAIQEPINYHFPDGTTMISPSIVDHSLFLYIVIDTNTDFSYSVTKKLKLIDNPHNVRILEQDSLYTSNSVIP